VGIVKKLASVKSIARTYKENDLQEGDLQRQDSKFQKKTFRQKVIFGHKSQSGLDTLTYRQL
jgi:CRISPR/Cas system CMR subunit Cmr6 (Cas7 group RAMP superfamily)